MSAPEPKLALPSPYQEAPVTPLPTSTTPRHGATRASKAARSPAQNHRPLPSACASAVGVYTKLGIVALSHSLMHQSCLTSLNISKNQVKDDGQGATVGTMYWAVPKVHFAKQSQW